MDTRKPNIEFHGPVATHDQACAVLWNEPAVYEFCDGAFHPSWKAQALGWRLLLTNRWQRIVLRVIGLGDKS